MQTRVLKVRLPIWLLPFGLLLLSPARPSMAGTVSGTVLDPAGQPVAGMAVEIQPEYLVTSRKVVTDAKGRFEFSPNPQLISQRTTRACVVVRDFARNLAAVGELNRDTTRLDLRLAPGLSVSGRLTDAQGKSLPRGHVQVQIRVGSLSQALRQDSVRIDAQGQFTLTALPMDHAYWVTGGAPGYGSRMLPVESQMETNRVDLGAFVLKVADLPLAGRVVGPDDQPATNAWVTVSGDGQPSDSTQVDSAGRFRFKAVCAGPARLFANAVTTNGGAFANLTVEGGDTNVVIVLKANGMVSRGTSARKKSAPAKARPLPDLSAVGLSIAAVPPGKPVLLCVIDLDQRSSRKLARAVAAQFEALQARGLVVAGVNTGSAPAALKDWETANPSSFPIGGAALETATTKWVFETEALPWLMLLDKRHAVVAEGFPLEDLETNLREMEAAAGK